MRDRLASWMRRRRPRRLGPRGRALLAAALTLVVSSVIMAQAVALREASNMADLREDVAATLHLYGNTLTATLDHHLALLNGLRAFALAHAPDQIEANVQAFMQGLHGGRASIRNLSLAPGGVQRYVYPLSGNETVPGHDLLADERPEVQADVQRAIETGAVVLSGPYALRQGGLGLVARQAIFQEGALWGLATVVLDVPTLLEEAGLAEGSEGLRLALRDEQGRVFFGEEAVFQDEAVLHSVELAGEVWTLAGVPTVGWAAAVQEAMPLFRPGMAAIVGLLVAVVYLSAGYQAQLSQQVAERTEEIIRTRGQLEQDSRQRRLAEAALRQSEARFRSAFANAPVGMALLDPRGKVLEANAAMCQVVGYSEAELAGMDIRAILHPDDRGTVDTLGRGLLRGQQTHIEMDQRCLHRDGHTVWGQASISLVRDEEGEPLHFIVQFIDRTQQKQIEEALWEQMLHNELILQNALDGFCTVDAEGHIQQVNPAFTAITGYSREALLEMRLADLEPEGERGGFAQHLEVALREGSARFEARCRCRGGRVATLSASISLVRTREGRFFFISVQDITERQEAEARLRESESLFRTLTENALTGIYILQDGLIRYVNPSLAEIFGYTPEEVIDRLSPLDVVQAEDRELVRENIRRRIEGEADFLHYVLRGKRKDGSLIFCEVLGRRIEYQGRPAVMGTLLDITERKRAELTEHEQRMLAEALRDTAALLTSTLDPQEVLSRILQNVGRVVPHDAANIMLVEGDVARAVHWQGYGPEGEAFLRRMRFPLDTPNFHYLLTTGKPCLVRDTGDPASGWVKWPETAWLHSYAAAPIQAHGQVIGFINLDSATPGFFTGAHAERLQAFADQVAIAIENAQLYDQIRRHADELEQRVAGRTAELEHERAQLQAILDSMGEGVIHVEIRGEGMRTRYINEQLLEMTGYSVEDWFQRLPELVQQMLVPAEMPPRTYLERMSRFLAQQRPFRGETQMRRKDGSLFDASLTVTLVSTPEGQPQSIVALVRDVSQEKALQKQRDRFIANASHELRTPIANIKMRLYLLRKQPQRFEAHMEVMELVAARMEKLVEHLLDLSRFERGVIALQQQTVTLQDLIRDVLRVQQPEAEARQITLSAELPDKPVRAHVDPVRITQVITNLVTNAINYTSAGGRVTVQLARQGQSALITVQDTGIGIPPEIQPQVFEAFFRASEGETQGTGLGLTIAREIVALHGGEISLESEVGRGSTFTVRLGLANNRTTGR